MHSLVAGLCVRFIFASSLFSDLLRNKCPSLERNAILRKSGVAGVGLYVSVFQSSGFCMNIIESPV